MIKVAVIGYGYWGPNLVRNFWECEDTALVTVCDRDEARLAQVRARYPAVRTTVDLTEILDDSEIDAVAVATPVSTHFELAMKALAADKHVLVEKPMADSSEKCRQMIEEAEKRGKTLMVDHTFPYTGAVRKLKELIDAGELGDIFYYDSTRVNLGLFQHDVSVIWDLAVHDLSIIDYLLRDRPVAVSATAMSHIAGQPANVAYLTLFFAGNTIAHIRVNWLAPVKVRLTLIGGSRKMIVYDDVEPTDKIRVYDKGVTLETEPDNVHQLHVGYRAGDVRIPHLDDREALRFLISHFADCVLDNKAPITSAASGLRVVQAMEAATKSAAERGTLVPIV